MKITLNDGIGVTYTFLGQYPAISGRYHGQGLDQMLKTANVVGAAIIDAWCDSDEEPNRSNFLEGRLYIPSTTVQPLKKSLTQTQDLSFPVGPGLSATIASLASACECD